MELVDPSDPRWAGVMRQVAERQRRQLDVELPPWPVYGLADLVERGWLGGWEQVNAVMMKVSLAYDGGALDEQLTVCSEPAASEQIKSIDWTLASMFRDAGRPYPVAGPLPQQTDIVAVLGSENVLVTVDDSPIPAVRKRLEPYCVWRLTTRGTIVTVTSSGHSPSALNLVSIADLGPYQQRRTVVIAARRDAHDRATPPRPLTGPDAERPLWAHQSLVAMVLAHTEQARTELDLDRPPPRPDRDWGRHWAATVRRQQELRDQDEHTAQDAVSAMVNQLTALQEDATWWSSARLRWRAISEVMWFTATGDDTVPSAPAQQEWLRLRGPRSRQPAMDAWQAWADKTLS